MNPMKSLLFIIAVCVWSVSAPNASSATPAPGKTNIVETVSTNVDLPRALLDRLSKFDSESTKSRNPFFPGSKGQKEATLNKPTTPVVPVVIIPPEDRLVLKGISGPTSGRYALVNDKILTRGEEANIRTSSGPVKVKCLEITDSSVVLKINDQEKTKELRLRSGP
jgi:hypothetical protein